jgi:TrmH family RNA methyltransferase
MLSALQPRIRIVQSPSNQWVKALRHAITHPPALTVPAGQRTGEPPMIALEGFHLVTEALQAGLALRVLFLREEESGGMLTRVLDSLGRGMQDPSAQLADTEILALPESLFRNLAGTEAPQPIAALVHVPETAPDGLLATPAPLVAVLCGLQDPGNVGTLLRSALAFGATAAVLLSGTVSPWNGKALRASAGASLRLPLMGMRNAAQLALLLRLHKVRSYAAVPVGGRSAEELPLGRPSALWIGNEGAGLGPAELAACDARITLPMAAASESLNAAVAGSLLLYEAARQRAAQASKQP